VNEAVLSIQDLTVEFDTPDGVVHAVDHVSYDVRPGEILGVVGESGCGKTVTALAVLGLVPRPPGRIVSGKILFDGNDLLAASRKELRRVRGSEIAMIFQDPQSSLNPVFTIGQQIADVLRAHDARVSARAVRARTVALLEMVGVPDAKARLGDYPHQWSGGMCQRAMIAMAMANRPRLLIADEPTTALDVTVQAQILDVLEAARRETGAATVLITHDLGVIAEAADRVIVMYAGRVVEAAGVERAFHAPRHPYTAGLMGSLPRLDAARDRLVAIPGQPPSLVAVPHGCAFHPRCALRASRARCVEEPPPLVPAGSEHHASACHFWDEMDGADQPGTPPGPCAVVTATAAAHGDGGAEVLRVEDLVVRFPVRSNVLRRVVGAVHAVDGISFTLSAGETLGLVGESGCGKTTTALAIMRLVRPTGGRIVLGGVDVSAATRGQLRAVRRGAQVVFQDPYASVNPRLTVQSIVGEPLAIHGTADHRQRRARVAELLDLVGLSPEHANRYPHEFSGGQLQRIGIARALALEPKMLILDEPVSALDVSIQAQIVTLLQELQERLGLAYLFISHDLAVVRHISHRVAVMRRGKIVEMGGHHLVYQRPSHPYTRSLLAAVPAADPSRRTRR